MLVVYRGERFAKLTRDVAERLLGDGRKADGFIMAHSYDGVKLSRSVAVDLRGEIFLSDELAKHLGPLGPNDLFPVDVRLEGHSLCFIVTATNHHPETAAPRLCTLSLEE